MKRIIAFVLVMVSLLSLSACVNDNSASYDFGGVKMFNPEYSKLIARSDIYHVGQIGSGTQGITVANGRLGGPLWQSSASILSMQINHTDVFTFSDSSAVSKDHSNDGGGGVGRLHINFGTNVFDSDTKNHLSMYEGRLYIDGKDVCVEAYADMNSDVLMLIISDNREVPKDITIDLTMLRPALREWGAHKTVTEVYEKENAVILRQTITEPCDTGITENDYYNAAALAVSLQGAEYSSSKPSSIGGRESIRITVPATKGEFAVVIGGTASMDTSVDVAEIAQNNSCNAKDYKTIRDESAEWWADFWSKSYVYLPSQPDFEQRRNYYLYLSAISNRGSYPSKYNGGIWCGEEDRRDWGSFYWNWNQDSLYQGLISANHIELLDAMFNMRETLYDNYETAAEQMFGAEGIYIPETCGVLGWETLPDDVAKSVAEYYTFKTSNRGSEFTEMTYRRNAFLSVWNWNVFGGDSQASFVSHSLIATQETAEYFWQKYLYTLDEEWLRNHAYKFIKGAAELYRTYDGFRKEADGYYHIYNTNLHEHIWAGKDCIDDLAMARGVFTVAVRASEILGVDQDLRRKWEDCRDNIAPYPLRTDEGALHAGVTDSEMAVKIQTDEKAFAQGLSPYFFIRDLHGTESPIFKMLEKYDVLTLESRDQKADKGAWKIAMNTYLHSPGYVNQVLDSKVDQNGSSRFHVDAARLGMGDDLGVILNTQYHVFTVNGIHPNLLFDQLDYYSIEGYGTFAAALQEGLNQSTAPTPDSEAVIRVFPAWPMAWDAKYKLAAKDGFLVASSLVNHEIEYVEITSQLGGECRVRNPWDESVDLYINGKKVKTIRAGENDLMKFDTEKGDVALLVKAGCDPNTYISETLEYIPYHTVNDDESNIVYNGKWTEKADENSFLGGYHYAKENGASVEYNFTGNGFELIMPVSPEGGEIQVYIDGSFKGMINTCSETSESAKTVYTVDNLKYEYSVGYGGYERHSLKLVKTGGEVMAIDGIKILTESGYGKKPANIRYINDNDSAVEYVDVSNDGCNWFYTANRAGEGAFNNDAHIVGSSGEGGIGSYCVITFEGTGIRVLTEKFNDMGLVRIYLDGEDMGEFDCYTDGARKSRDTLYSVSGLENGEHTLKLEKVSGQYMIIDYFEIETLE